MKLLLVASTLIASVASQAAPAILRPASQASQPVAHRRLTLDLTKVQLTCHIRPGGYLGDVQAVASLVDLSGTLDTITTIDGHQPSVRAIDAQAENLCLQIEDVRRDANHSGKRLIVEAIVEQSRNPNSAGVQSLTETLRIRLTTGTELRSVKTLRRDIY